MPAIFVAHGAPPLLDDAGWMAELRAWGVELPRPTGILMVSAHWEERPLTLGAVSTVPLLYDFYGFPPRFYEVKYTAPGAPALAQRVRELASAAGIPTADEPRRGLDHGVFIPLLAMYPRADVPVLQVSMPSLRPAELFAVGEALAPLRDEGILVAGSGFLTHNLGAFSDSPVPPSWAVEFDVWVAGVLADGDVDALLDFERKAPAVRLAHPRTEHFAPVIVAAGASRGDPATFPIAGFTWGAFSRRSVLFGVS